jgi:hypothetical protein
MPIGIQDGLQHILDHYHDTPPGSPWGSNHTLYRIFDDLTNALRNAEPVQRRPTLKTDFAGRGRQAALPWIAILDRRETRSTQEGIYCVYLFREDLSAVYLTLAVGVTIPRRQRGAGAPAFLAKTAEDLSPYVASLTTRGFRLDKGIDLHSSQQLGRDYETGTVAYKPYESGAIPNDDQLLQDLEALLSAYDAYLLDKIDGAPPPPPPIAVHELPIVEPFDLSSAIEGLVRRIGQAHYVFEPWQVAAYVTALRTKPFVILAGVTGTGKSTLPRLVAEATGGESRLVPVRPDWTDSADVLGYSDLQERFRPGAVLQVAREAMEHPEQYWTCVLDEMNLARVEQYFAEVLSRIEDRRPHPDGGYMSQRLLGENVRDAQWSQVVLAPNFGLVGTVNMDESAHGFSRKVLDRAFTLELSEISLTRWESEVAPGTEGAYVSWPPSAWYPRANALGHLTDLTPQDREVISRIITTLTQVNSFLTQAQLQVGYRTRDEVALFVLHAGEISSTFVTSANEQVDPLDLALHMKVLPRIIGGSGSVRRAILQLMGWATSGVPLDSEDQTQPIMNRWEAVGRANALPGVQFPRTAARLCLMWERVMAEGFTSFWL